MKEDFLHYLWKFQKFNTKNLKTTNGEVLTIISPGQHQHNAGPDFFFAKINWQDQLWVGNVEIHLKSSHWYAHKHHQDKNYDNVILHVVWEHDVEVINPNNQPIPVLVLKDIVDKKLLTNYNQFSFQQFQFIPCENKIKEVSTFSWQNWLSRLYWERLEDKTQPYFHFLNETQNNWEALLFTMLAKNFGLKINADSFLSIAQSIPYTVIRKERNVENLEALLFGQAGLLEDEAKDAYQLKLKETYQYLKLKYKLSNQGVIAPKYFRLRPANFPTIRLAQLAYLWAFKPLLFSEIEEANTLDQVYSIFQSKTSDYWQEHYNFGVKSLKSNKTLSKNFIYLIIINTIIPLKYVTALKKKTTPSSLLEELALQLKGEKNSIIDGYKELVTFQNNALNSQALIQLKNTYCNHFKCMQCVVGNEIIKQ